MGGCQCKLEGVGNGNASDSEVLHQQSLKSDGSLTINNNYNNNNISIIDGSTITTTNGAQNVQPLVFPKNEAKSTSGTNYTDLPGKKITTVPSSSSNENYIKPDDSINMILQNPGPDG